MGPLRFMVLASEYDGNRKEQSRCRLWEECLYHMEKKGSKEKRAAIRGRTTVVFGLKSQIVGNVEGKSMVMEMNALNKRFKST